MDLVSLLDAPDPVNALIDILERSTDVNRMDFAIEVRPPGEAKPTGGEPPADVERARRAFDDLRYDGTVSDAWGHHYFDPGGYGHYASWLLALDLVGATAWALLRRDHGQVERLAVHFWALP